VRSDVLLTMSGESGRDVARPRRLRRATRPRSFVATARV